MINLCNDCKFYGFCVLNDTEPVHNYHTHNRRENGIRTQLYLRYIYDTVYYYVL